MIWVTRTKTFHFEQTLLMGVVNVTPDSFSDGGKFLDVNAAKAQALRLVEEGADILDFGAESSRPDAEPVSADEEMERLLPVLKDVREATSKVISIDTTKPAVARACLELGADVINDISGLRDSDGELARVVKDYEAGLVVMHRRGNAKTMQSLTQYQDVVEEVLEELGASVHLAMEAGLEQTQIAVDPGIGFSKTAEQNLEILKDLRKFHELDCPVLLGPSRKSFIGHVTGREVTEREFGTAAVVADAVAKGIQMIRIHNVKAMRDVTRMAEALRRREYVRT